MSGYSAHIMILPSGAEIKARRTSSRSARLILQRQKLCQQVDAATPEVLTIYIPGAYVGTAKYSYVRKLRPKGTAFRPLVFVSTSNWVGCRVVFSPLVRVVFPARDQPDDCSVNIDA